MAERTIPPLAPEIWDEALMVAADSARIGVSMVFLDGDIRVAFINNAGAEILGYTKEEALGMSSLEMLPPDERAAVRERREKMVPLPNWQERMARTKDGRDIVISVGMSFVRVQERPAVVSFFLDITEQRKAIEAVGKSELRFRRLIEMAPDAVWIFDGQKLAFVNSTAVKMLGYPDAATLLAVSPLDLVVEEERAPLIERSRMMMQSGQGMAQRDYLTKRFDGSVITVEVQSLPIDWEGRSVLLSFGRDVSARKEMEARLTQGDRLSALGTLVAGIAHEINNPLTFTLFSLELALREIEKAGVGVLVEDVRGRLEEAKLGAERVAAIVRDLRAFARLDSESRVPVRLDEVISAAVRIAQNEIRHHARLETKFQPVPAVEGNPARLEQVFLNLLVNASQALPEDRANENQIEVRVFSPNEAEVVAEVTDNGPGISPSTRARIFDPFFTTKEPGGGTGLGLSICHRIVTAHGGTIEVDSAPGEGTTFRVRLPVSTRAATAAPAPSEARAKPVVRSERKLLVVDDDPGVGNAIARMMKGRFECQVVTDARAALAVIGKSQFDIVLCDLMMPGMTGEELVAEVARQHPGVERRFVFMTGGALTKKTADFAARLKRPLLEKPFSVASLEEALDQIGVP